MKKCHANVYLAKWVYASPNQTRVYLGELLESQRGRAYQCVGGSQNYSPISIPFVQERLQGISINLCPPDQCRIDLACPGGMQIKPVV
jgi:hypothetical protein